MKCPQCGGVGFFEGERWGDDNMWIQSEDTRCEHCQGTGRRAVDRVIDGKEFCWEGHYLVDERRYCPHRVFMDYHCDDCDRDYGWQGKDPAERKVTR